MGPSAAWFYEGQLRLHRNNKSVCSALSLWDCLYRSYCEHSGDFSDSCKIVRFLYSSIPGPPFVNNESGFGFDGAVLLAPYCMTGLLTGRAYSDSDPKSQKLLEDWRRYFYISSPADNAVEDGSHVPLFVEVVVGV